MNRREFFAVGAAGFAASVARPAVPGRWQLGFSLYGMKALKLADALSACAKIGYDGVELALMPGYAADPKMLVPDDRRDLRKRLGDSGLSLLGLMENLIEPSVEAIRKSNLEKLKAAAELGNELSPKTPPAIETILGGKPADWEKVKGPLFEKLQAWAKVAVAHKTVIAIKPHVSNALHTPDAALELVKQIDSPWIRLAFDHSHFALQGLKLSETLPKLLPLTSFVHIKDAKGKPDKFEFLLPGDGDTDYADYFARLTKADYAGPVVVEVSGQISNKSGYDPVMAAKRCFANLAKVRGN